jgi:hypothetical protein
MALALRRFEGPVRAFCLGDDEEAMRYALAAGASSAERLDDSRSLEFDVLLVGGGGAGPGGDWLLARLAEDRQCDLVLEVLDVEPGPDGLMVTRDLGRGDREQLALSGAAVLAISEEAPRLDYVSRDRRRRVSVSSSSPSSPLTVDPLAGVSGPWEPARPRARTEPGQDRIQGTASARMQALLGISGPEGGVSQKEHVIIADAPICARHLLRYLGHHGFLGEPAGAVAPVTDAERGTQEQAPPAPGAVRDSQPAPGKGRRGPRPLEGESRRAQRRPREIKGGGGDPGKRGSS